MQRILTAICLASLASCASIVNSNGFRSVEVSSVPNAARFTSNASGVQGVTPAIVQLPNGEPVTFQFELDGYEPLTHVARPRTSGWIAGNLLFGGLIGIVIDVVNRNSRIHGDVDVALLPVRAEVTPTALVAESAEALQ